jgi:hypothetical protein
MVGILSRKGIRRGGGSPLNFFSQSHDRGMWLDLVISNIVWPNFSCGNSR